MTFDEQYQEYEKKLLKLSKKDIINNAEEISCINSLVETLSFNCMCAHYINIELLYKKLVACNQKINLTNWEDLKVFIEDSLLKSVPSDKEYIVKSLGEFEGTFVIVLIANDEYINIMYNSDIYELRYTPNDTFTEKELGAIVRYEIIADYV